MWGPHREALEARRRKRPDRAHRIPTEPELLQHLGLVWGVWVRVNHRRVRGTVPQAISSAEVVHALDLRGVFDPEVRGTIDDQLHALDVTWIAWAMKQLPQRSANNGNAAGSNRRAKKQVGRRGP